LENDNPVQKVDPEDIFEEPETESVMEINASQSSPEPLPARVSLTPNEGFPEDSLTLTIDLDLAQIVYVKVFTYDKREWREKRFQFPQSGQSVSDYYEMSYSLEGYPKGKYFFWIGYHTYGTSGPHDKLDFTVKQHEVNLMNTVAILNNEPINKVNLGTLNNTTKFLEEDTIFKGAFIYNKVNNINRPFAIARFPYYNSQNTILEYRYSLPSTVASVRYRYSYREYNSSSSVKWSDYEISNGYLNTIEKISLPNYLGKYEITIEFEYFNSSKISLGSETRAHTFYLLYKRPPTSLKPFQVPYSKRRWKSNSDNYEPYIDIDFQHPRTEWLDMATAFLYRNGFAGSMNEEKTLEAITTGIYTLGNWEYGYYLPIMPKDPDYGDIGFCPPTWLIENRKPDSLGDLPFRGDCIMFQKVLVTLAASLGLTVNDVNLKLGKLFMTDPLQPALDGYASANAYAVEDINDPYPANGSTWWFTDHALGRSLTYGNNFYDPTFNVIGSDEKKNVYALLSAGLDNGYGEMELVKYPQAKFNIQIPDEENIGHEYYNKNGWVKLKYEDPESPAKTFNPIIYNPTITALQAAKLNSLIRINKGLIRVPPGVSIESMDYEMVDNDENGLAEWLAVDVDVYSFFEYNATIVADIYASSGEYITSGSLTSIPAQQPILGVFLEGDGLGAEFTAYFVGRLLQEAELDGPYEINIQVWGEEEFLCEDWLITDSHDAGDFQGKLLTVDSITDTLEDTSGGLAQTIRFTANINAAISGTYNLSGSLFKDLGDGEQATLDNLYQEVPLTVGINVITFNFDAAKIQGRGLEGPYEFYLSANDGLYASYDSHTSDSYLLSQLTQPAAYFNGNFSEDIIPRLGKVPGLMIGVPLIASIVDIYTVKATLYDQDGNPIDYAEKTLTIDTVGTVLELVFNSSSIYVYEVDGPYIVSVAIFDQTDKLLVGREYETQAYTFDMFDPDNFPLMGDVDEDGDVTEADAMLILEYVVGNILLTSDQLFLADVNRDGEVTPEDAMVILQYVYGYDFFNLASTSEQNAFTLLLEGLLEQMISNIR
jgi:hypothetical protein